MTPLGRAYPLLNPLTVVPGIGEADGRISNPQKHGMGLSKAILNARLLTVPMLRLATGPPFLRTLLTLVTRLHRRQSVHGEVAPGLIECR